MYQSPPLLVSRGLPWCIHVWYAECCFFTRPEWFKILHIWRYVEYKHLTEISFKSFFFPSYLSSVSQNSQFYNEICTQISSYKIIHLHQRSCFYYHVKCTSVCPTTVLLNMLSGWSKSSSTPWDSLMTSSFDDITSFMCQDDAASDDNNGFWHSAHSIGLFITVQIAKR